MRKFLQSGKIWTILSALIFVMACGLVVYAATLSTSSSFSSWKSSKISNILTATDWDVLMDKLELLDSNVQGLNSTVDGLDSIPDGAIMAFNLTECPIGWSEYYDADGRFLMGGKTESSNQQGGFNQITLTAGQLPRHSHIFADTVFSEKGDIEDYATENQYLKDYIVAEKYPMGGNETYMVGKHGQSIDTDNYLWAGLRKTGASICTDGGVTIDGKTDTPITSANIKPLQRLGVNVGNVTSLAENNCSSGNPNTVDITNAYVKVKYCVKGVGERVKIHVNLAVGGHTTAGSYPQGFDANVIKGAPITTDGSYVYAGTRKLLPGFAPDSGYKFSQIGFSSCGKYGEYKAQKDCVVTIFFDKS